jgi:cysteine desulfurase
MKRVYLDFNATTPLDPRVALAMRAVLEEGFGNPSSAHWAGLAARELVEAARAQVASLLGCAAEEVVFTSGGSEANNLALKGVYFARGDGPAHIITSAVEHPSILAPCGFLERLGARVTRLPVDGSGRIDPDDLRRAITPDTILITVMHANNEVGTIQPIEDCARIAREHGVPLHTDAAQSAGKLPVAVERLGVDLLSVAGHKLYAPKGVGALYVRKGTRLEPLIHGAGHEAGRRAGTESVLLATGLGTACDLARDLSWTDHAGALRDRFWAGLRERLDGNVVQNGHPAHRLPNTLNVSFIGRIGAEVLAGMQGVAASTGSACHSGRTEISPVLKAMGVADDVGVGAVRFSLGRTTTREEIDAVIASVAQAVAMSALSPSPHGPR